MFAVEIQIAIARVILAILKVHAMQLRECGEKEKKRMRNIIIVLSSC